MRDILNNQFAYSKSWQYKTYKRPFHCINYVPSITLTTLPNKLPVNPQNKIGQSNTLPVNPYLPAIKWNSPKQKTKNQITINRMIHKLNISLIKGAVSTRFLDLSRTPICRFLPNASTTWRKSVIIMTKFGKM